MLIKADLHIHSCEDPKDDYIKYSARDIIDRAHSLGFKVLCFALHDSVLDDVSLKSYAKNKNILLIRGAEVTIEGKHVLVYNINNDDLKNIKSFDDLRVLKLCKGVFVVAPHPFYSSFFSKYSLNKSFFMNLDVFDALEFSRVYNFLYNPNKKVFRVAKKLGLPILANSDAHFFGDFGYHYSLIKIRGALSVGSFFSAVKKNRVIHKSRSLSLGSSLVLVFGFFFRVFKKKFFK